MPRITELYLVSNDFGQEGAEHLASALANMNHMTSLSLNDNWMGVEGVRCLLPSFTRMSQLSFLDLKFNNLSSEAEQEVYTKLCHVGNLRLENISFDIQTETTALDASLNNSSNSNPSNAVNIGVNKTDSNNNSSNTLQISNQIISATSNSSSIINNNTNFNNLHQSVAQDMQ
eukprot:c11727_g1_i3.p2 GENE.c11727_g1_i3~~c11727_g1_i3.p2  ORF type:complete len:173 (-),score=69.18 c11727_g1_i3:152-670(-)